MGASAEEELAWRLQRASLLPRAGALGCSLGFAPSSSGDDEEERARRWAAAKPFVPRAPPRGAAVSVSNFGTSVTEQALRAMFEPFGEVTGARVTFEPARASRARSAAVVEFASAEAADKAVAALDGRLAGGRTMAVVRAVTRRRAAPTNAHCRRQ